MNKEIDCLWRKVFLGDEVAFDVLFKELYPNLLNFAQRLLGNHPDAEETVQDTFVNLWNNRKNIIIKGSIKSYLYQVVHNLAINKLEHFKTNRFLPNKLVSEERWLQIYHGYTIDDTFISELEAKETEELILKAVDQLPEKCREVFLLSRYENLNYEEIANKLQLSQNTIRVQIFRALEYLRIYLKKINP